jgi:hypothetical protein
MTTPIYGVTLGPEIIAAGIGGLNFSWEPDTGRMVGRENLTDEQNATLEAVIAAHDPTKKLADMPPTSADPMTELKNQVAELTSQVAELMSKRKR